MKLKHNNQNYIVRSKIENNEIISSINNNNLSSKIEKIDDNSLYIWLDGHKHKAYFSKDKKSAYVWIDGYSFKFDLIDEDQSGFEGSSDKLNRQEVTAPMPGSIVKVLVEIGQQVSEATPLVIVEAMKMETTLYSQINGIVKEINCNEKEQVDSDKILLVIEKE